MQTVFRPFTKVVGLAAKCSLLVLCCGCFGSCAINRKTQLPAEAEWKLATVVRIARGAEIQDPDRRECLRDIPADERADELFLVARYRSGRAHFFKTVLMPSAFRPAIGESVWIAKNDCTATVRQASDAPTSLVR